MRTLSSNLYFLISFLIRLIALGKTMSELETLCFVTYGKFVGENDDYYYVATTYNSYDHNNNDMVRLLKDSTIDIKVLERGDL